MTKASEPLSEAGTLKRCGAKRRNGKRCRQWPMKGCTRCRIHGGKTPKGIALPQFKHGRFSSYMPPQLAKRFREAAEDPSLLSLDRDVALVDTRLAEMLQEIGKPGGRWDAVIAAKERATAAKARGDTKALGESLTELFSAIESGKADEDRWREIVESLIESRRKLIDSIHKHQVQSAEILTLTEAQTLFTGMAMLVRTQLVGLMGKLREDADRKAAREALSEIASGFARLTNAGPPALTEKNEA